MFDGLRKRIDRWLAEKEANPPPFPPEFYVTDRGIRFRSWLLVSTFFTGLAAVTGALVYFALSLLFIVLSPNLATAMEDYWETVLFSFLVGVLFMVRHGSEIVDGLLWQGAKKAAARYSEEPEEE
ncbi:hypothetical protein [Kitasatospora viridis]|uniref:Uncharacterized protein n=1 Tax=Kitasatospora viridis TaxID=281105 RepID=A0A561SA46_9ACTN|nr:hypothetical protein [Kitasatospora viridis]TWF71748.1 hypothetical protein FHX73_18119 [Kitasatospora viridis]